MNSFILRFTTACIVLNLLFFTKNYSQEHKTTSISGKVSLDSTWSSNMYLSHINSYEDMHLMSNKMIIAETVIDSLGYFNFSLDYLPQGEHLYRLHVVKKGDSRATLIIGGKDENHLFFILKSTSHIQFACTPSLPPFRRVSYKNSPENTAFHQITQLVFKADSIAAESSASKRSLVESKLYQELQLIADTSTNFLVSQYAIHKNPTLTAYSSNEEFYNAYSSKWENQDNGYYKAFENKIPVSKEKGNSSIFILLGISLMLVVLVGVKTNLFQTNKLKTLSIQERKIFELLKQGATNQEISDELNIGLSTVKSHASSIYSKLKVKSRKDIVNMK